MNLFLSKDKLPRVVEDKLPRVAGQPQQQQQQQQAAPQSQQPNQQQQSQQQQPWTSGSLQSTANSVTTAAGTTTTTATSVRTPLQTQSRQLPRQAANIYLSHMLSQVSIQQLLLTFQQTRFNIQY